jgi:serine/threonine-protein phosphatase 2A regulatory subunit A
VNVNFVLAYHVQELNSSMFYSVQRLAAGEWFTARVSSCGLFHIAYPSAPDQLKTELRTIYGQLCQDDMPMVRRAAASNLGKFAATVEQSHLKTEIMSIFDDLTQDGIFLIHVLMNCFFS